MKFSKISYLIATIFSFTLTISCSTESTSIEPFNQAKPYSIQVSKERSLYQAEKISSRLNDMNLNSYVIQHEDSSSEDGSWFHILCENIETLDSAKAIRKRLESSLNIEDLEIVKFEDFKSANFNLDTLKASESQRINSKKPDLKNDIFEVISKFPESNALYVQKTFVVNTPEDPENKKGFSSIYQFNMDLPRGISEKRILNEMLSFSEVIYKDNLYGDQVTIDIGKLRKDTSSQEIASTLKIAEKYADLILETGKYRFEEKKELIVKAYKNLEGFKVTIETRKDNFRTYLILVEKDKDFIFFCQSTDKTQAELLKIIESIGNGEGLLSYNEFYNTFYTLPENRIADDLFIGFTINKLTWRYAEQRDYVKWSKEMVGHWYAKGHFYNKKKGLWTYSLFDLLNEGGQEYIYGNLYSKDRGGNKEAITIGETNGFAVYKKQFNNRTWKFYNKLIEINYGIGRYVSSVNNSEYSYLNKAELIERAETFQYNQKKSKDLEL